MLKDARMEEKIEDLLGPLASTKFQESQRRNDQEENDQFIDSDISIDCDR